MPEQRWIRVIPVAFIMYTIAFIDRTNISLAQSAMSHDLHMDPAQAGNAAGVFFWGYLVLQIPGGYFAHRWSAKRFVSLLLVAWGVSSVLTGFVHTSREFMVMRFLLGVAEGGVWPATLVLLANWFPRAERARANAFWMLCLPVAVVLSSPLSGWILGRWNWRVLLVTEGLFPILWLAVWLWFISDYPHQASWISREEREYLETTLRRESSELEPAAPEPYLRALLRPQVLILVAVYVLQTSGTYGYLFWLPTALGSVRKLSSLFVGVLFMIPYLMTAVGMVLNARHSDRKRERRGHVAFAEAWGGVFLLGAVLTAGHSTLTSFVFICLAGAGPYAALGPFWAIPTETLPRGVAAPAMGLINAIGNLGGYFGPLVVGFLNKKTGSFVYGFGLLSVGLLVASTLAFLLRPAQAATPVGDSRSQASAAPADAG